MVPVLTLWLPILLAAVLVFVVSSIIHMFLGYHRNDYIQVPDEDGVMSALRPFGIPPGDYILPRAGSNEEMKSEEFQARVTQGPVIFMTVLPNGMPGMGKSMVQWFLYCLLIGVFSAYVTGRAFGPGTDYLVVVRFSGTVAFAGYALALLQNSIWFKRNWAATMKSMFDGLVYGVLTAGVFGWLWP